MSENFTVESRKEYRNPQSQGVTIDEIKLGCFQRIAAAVEMVAIHHDELLRERDYFKRRMEEAHEANKKLRLRNAALRGVITKLKK